MKDERIQDAAEGAEEAGYEEAAVAEEAVESAAVQGPPSSAAPTAARAAVRPAVAPGELPAKSPALAAFLAFLPGLGHVYNGLYARAITFFAIWIALFGSAVTSRDESEMPFLVPTMIFFLLFNVFDSYRQATFLNYGYTEDPAIRQKAVAGLGTGGLAPGVALVLVGLYGLLRKYFDFSLSWLFENWPLIIIALGAWLIFQSIRERQATADAA